MRGSGIKESASMRGYRSRNPSAWPASGNLGVSSSAPKPTARAGYSVVRVGVWPGTRTNHSPFRQGIATTSSGEIKSNAFIPRVGRPFAKAIVFASTTPTRTPMKEPGPMSAIHSSTSLTLLPLASRSSFSIVRHAADAARGASKLRAPTSPPSSNSATDAHALDVEIATITSVRHSETGRAWRSSRAGRLRSSHPG